LQIDAVLTLLESAEVEGTVRRGELAELIDTQELD